MEREETIEKENTKPVKDRRGRLQLFLGVGNIFVVWSLNLVFVIFILLAAMLFTRIDANLKIHSYEATVGYVEKFRISGENESKFPVISYQVDDETYEYQCDLKVTTLQPGDEVEVLYKADDPSEATTKLRLLLWPKLIWKAIKYCIGAAIVCGIMALIFNFLSFSEFTEMNGGTK